jgi:hypothetical protein
VNRRLGTRLARLEELAPQATGTPECKFHGVHCQLGANWPLPYPRDQEIELVDLIRDAQRATGQEVEPHPREVWATDRHERVPDEEIAQRERELAEALAQAKAWNDALEAQIRGEAP